jgi:hypothetical protein
MTDDPQDDAMSPFMLPPALVQSIVMEHDKENMRADALRMEMNNFIDSLDKNQLLALMHLLSLRRGALHMIRGQAIALLRTKFHVDEQTGEPLAP